LTLRLPKSLSKQLRHHFDDHELLSKRAGEQIGSNGSLGTALNRAEPLCTAVNVAV
jgi:hypothetical protein